MACTRRRSWASGWRSSVSPHFGVASGRRAPFVCADTASADGVLAAFKRRQEPLDHVREAALAASCWPLPSADSGLPWRRFRRAYVRVLGHGWRLRCGLWLLLGHRSGFPGHRLLGRRPLRRRAWLFGGGHSSLLRTRRERLTPSDASSNRVLAATDSREPAAARPQRAAS
jgi:hypothetical protein